MYQCITYNVLHTHSVIMQYPLPTIYTEYNNVVHRKCYVHLM